MQLPHSVGPPFWTWCGHTSLFSDSKLISPKVKILSKLIKNVFNFFLISNNFFGSKWSFIMFQGIQQIKFNIISLIFQGLASCYQLGSTKNCSIDMLFPLSHAIFSFYNLSPLANLSKFRLNLRSCVHQCEIIPLHKSSNVSRATKFNTRVEKYLVWYECCLAYCTLSFEFQLL